MITHIRCLLRSAAKCSTSSCLCVVVCWGTSMQRTPAQWDWWRGPALLLELNYQPWMRWRRTDYSLNCRQLWTMRRSPSANTGQSSEHLQRQPYSGLLNEGAIQEIFNRSELTQHLLEQTLHTFPVFPRNTWINRFIIRYMLWLKIVDLVIIIITYTSTLLLLLSVYYD